MFLVSQSQIPPNFHCIFNKMEKNMLTEVLGEVGSRILQAVSICRNYCYRCHRGFYSSVLVYEIGNIKLD